MIINDDGDNISWYLSDLIRWGFIKNNDQWSEFTKYMNDSAMRFFEGDEFNADNN